MMTNEKLLDKDFEDVVIFSFQNQVQWDQII